MLLQEPTPTEPADGAPQGGATDAGLPLWGWATALAAALLIVFTRRPDAFLNPQFYAEDGAIFYAQAANLGWLKATGTIYAGYYHLLPRLIAAVSMAFPLAWAPAVFNLSGLLVQLAAPLFLLSRRMASLGSLKIRLAMAFCCLTVPSAFEMNLTPTESQWHLALLAALLLVARPPRTRLGWAASITALALSAFTGPFSILLTPLAGWLCWRRRERYLAVAAAILAASAAVQLISILVLAHGQRSVGPLGASLPGLVRLVGGNVLLASVLGAGWEAAFPVLLILFVLAAVLAIFCLRRMPPEWRILLIYAALVLAASLANPLIPLPPAGLTVWQMLPRITGAHYWFLPILAWQWMLIWFALEPGAGRNRRALGWLLLAVLGLGIGFHWQLPAFEDTHFGAQAAACQAAPAGSTCVIQENPLPWTFSLVRH